jgi:hypothetical protein
MKVVILAGGCGTRLSEETIVNVGAGRGTPRTARYFSGPVDVTLRRDCEA